MRKKSSPEKEKMQPSECDACKRCKLNVNQQNEEFISKEELHKRNGIAEGKNDYFTLYLNHYSWTLQIHPATRTCHDCFPQARRNFLPGTRNAGRI